jgi:hypothetical protein
MQKKASVLSRLIPEPVFLSLMFRILGMYLLFGLCRLLFVLFNYRYFTYGGAGTLLNWIWGGLVFDTVAIVYINVFYIFLATLPLQIRYKKWYQAILSVIFIITNSVALAANLTDIFYLSH